MKVVSVGQLFFHRLKYDWKMFWNTIRSAVDWTVALYIVVPIVALLGYQYYSWWNSVPDWFVVIPEFIILLVFYIFTLSGKLSLFVTEGDKLFLLQRKTWMDGLKKRALTYSLLLSFGNVLLLYLFMLPLLVHGFGWNWSFIILFYFLFALMQCFQAFVTNFTYVFFRGWKRVFIRLALRLLLAVVFLSMYHSMLLLVGKIIILFIGLIYLVRYRYDLRGTFDADVAFEAENKSKLTAVLLSQVVDLNRINKRKRPLIFRRSQSLFKTMNPINGLTNTSIKVFLRQGSQLMFLAYFTSICCSALIFTSKVVGAIFLIGVACLLGYRLRLFWSEFMDKGYVRLFHWDAFDQHKAAKKFIFIFMLLPIGIMCLVYAFQFTLLLLPVFVLLAIGLCHVIAEFSAPWSGQAD